MSETNRYRTIVADPPWDIGAFPANFGYESGKGVPYSTMTVDEIAALPVKRMANNRDGDAHLYLWTINDYLEDSFDVARAWGFEPSATLVWCKKPAGLGLGGIFASNVEFILFCRRSGYVSLDKRVHRADIAAVTTRINEIIRAAGYTVADVNGWVGAVKIGHWWMTSQPWNAAIPKPEHWETLKRHVPALVELDDDVAALNAEKGKHRKVPVRPSVLVETRWFQWPRGKHSVKPDAFLDMVEQVSPGPYLELFARRQRLGWDTWGNEALEHVDLEGTAA